MSQAIQAPAPAPTPRRRAAPTCPKWCAGGHPEPDPDHYGAWIHSSAPRSVSVEDDSGKLLISLTRFDELEQPPPHNIGTTTVGLTLDLFDHYAEYSFPFHEAHALVTELLGAMNQALPPGEQTFLCPPGIEFVRDDDCDW